MGKSRPINCARCIKWMSKLAWPRKVWWRMSREHPKKSCNSSTMKNTSSNSTKISRSTRNLDTHLHKLIFATCATMASDPWLTGTSSSSRRYSGRMIRTDSLLLPKASLYPSIFPKEWSEETVWSEDTSSRKLGRTSAEWHIYQTETSMVQSLISWNGSFQKTKGRLQAGSTLI